MGNKNTYLLVGVLVGLVVLILLVQLLFGNKKDRPKTPQTTPTPSTARNFSDLINTEEQIPSSYTKLGNDYQRIADRKDLSENDKQIRNKILLDKVNGLITVQEHFKVEYLKTPKYFMVEINYGDTDQAKEEALDWFKTQGMSIEGICDLPVIFYLGPDIDSQYRSNKLQFDPTIEGCN
jgi:hypothetical protein